MARPKGLPKTGGRKAGSINQRTREIAERAIDEGISPLEVMLCVMRDAYATKDNDKALDAAHKAAPYMHARLSSVEQTGADGGPIETKSHIDIRFVSAQTEGDDDGGDHPT